MPTPNPTPFASLERLAEVWRSRVDGPARKAAVAASVGALFGLAHLARLGTLSSRIAAGALWVAFIAALVARAIMNARGWKDPAWIVSRTIVPTDADLGHRALRAMRLVDRTRVDPSAGSSELASAHLERTLGRAQPSEIGARASSVGRWLQRGALLAGGAALVAVAIGPFRVIEGLDVLIARRGVAPIAFEWLDEAGLTGHPPDYLHQRDVIPTNLAHAEFPYGSLLTLRGVPIHKGRALVVTDGTTEVPFVDDATGGVVARWPLTASVHVRVGARFGGVLIPEPFTMELTSIPDDEPKVQLEGAPRTEKLLDARDIEITYEASDDHGLREVHLVLRSGDREERRVLARLDGETRHDRGGHRLWASDRFFKRAFAPIEITVEARDNDPLRGPKWGKSAPITLIPPLVGEPEALRYAALARSRDAFVDLLAFRIENEGDLKGGAGPLRAHGLRETNELNSAMEILERGLDESYGGLRVARRIRTLAEGQLRKLREGLGREVAQTNSRTHGANRKLTEDFTLTLDSLLRRLDVTDATSIAKRLAEIADDGAEAAAGAKRPSEREHSLGRLDIDVGILTGGGGQLRKLGSLGEDLGEIVMNDLARAARGRSADDFVHAELALRDLAARLRHPAPSFGGGRSGGVESGGGGGSPEGDASEGGQQIAREQEQIEELARDHGAEVSGVEQAMNNAESNEELGKLREEAKQHADAVREAVRSLPRSGGEPNSAEAAATTAREHAEAMADQLERGSPAEAVKSGHNSEGALEQSERAPSDRFGIGRNAREQAKVAREKIAPEVRWAERALERLRQAASARAADNLKKTSPREGKLAERAKGLSEEGNRGEGALPGETLELLQSAESAMREGARALGAAEGERALQRLKEAQRLLEMAKSNDEGDEGAPRDQAQEGEKPGKGDKEGNSTEFSHRAPIPKAEDYKGPEAFRRRVLEGLGQATDPRMKEAVKRYAEGLLR